MLPTTTTFYAARASALYLAATGSTLSGARVAASFPSQRFGRVIIMIIMTIIRFKSQAY